MGYKNHYSDLFRNWILGSEFDLLDRWYTVMNHLQVLIWDIILHLPQDYELLKRSRINRSFVIYAIARQAEWSLEFYEY